MQPYKTSHTFVTPQGTYTTTLEFSPAAESVPEVSPIKDDLIDAAIANIFLVPCLSTTEARIVRFKAQQYYSSIVGTPALKASKAVSRAILELRLIPQ